jgi:hypothetical protein
VFRLLERRVERRFQGRIEALPVDVERAGAGVAG